ncbi:hypothetical protein DLM46_34535 [Paraburkholderia lacunae]|uniref:Uncharacterized protein n=1 Tax=Paraburkholderia lacunae TaxID=2211104 RepID=A0A370MXP7_9BURK|nr:hypothetical protein DLM46_34535 [Paraburkholderia lacunae]
MFRICTDSTMMQHSALLLPISSRKRVSAVPGAGRRTACIGDPISQIKAHLFSNGQSRQREGRIKK